LPKRAREAFVAAISHHLQVASISLTTSDRRDGSQILGQYVQPLPYGEWGTNRAKVLWVVDSTVVCTGLLEEEQRLVVYGNTFGLCEDLSPKVKIVLPSTFIDGNVDRPTTSELQKAKEMFTESGLISEAHQPFVASVNSRKPSAGLSHFFNRLDLDGDFQEQLTSRRPEFNVFVVLFSLQESLIVEGFANADRAGAPREFNFASEYAEVFILAFELSASHQAARSIRCPC
jgi:hypothetical protein